MEIKIERDKSILRQFLNEMKISLEALQNMRFNP